MLYCIVVIVSLCRLNKKELQVIETVVMKKKQMSIQSDKWGSKGGDHKYSSKGHSSDQVLIDPLYE